mgnify:FL=1
MFKNYFVILTLMFALSACAPKYQASDMCANDLYNSFDSIFNLIPFIKDKEPVLVLMCPLPFRNYDQISEWFDKGKFDYKESFMGYWMVGLDAKHMPLNRNVGRSKEDRCNYDGGCIKEITISLNQGAGLKNQYDHKLASISNIKSDLSDVCGTNWEPMRATQRFPQRSYKDSVGHRKHCIFELDNIKKQYNITFYNRNL